MAQSATTPTEVVLVKYTGPSTVRREITVKQAKELLHVDIDNDLVWDRSNRHTLDLTGAPEELMEYLKESDQFQVKRTNPKPTIPGTDSKPVGNPTSTPS